MGKRWVAFKADMNSVGFSEPEADLIIDRARLVLRTVAEISDDLIERQAKPAAAVT